MDIFAEEAMDLNQSMAFSLLHWKNDYSNKAPLTQIKRDLHTLKGGARMLEQNDISALAHTLEAYCDIFLSQEKPVTLEQYEVLSKIFDHLGLMIECLKKQEKIPYPEQEIQILQKLIGSEATEAVFKPEVSVVAESSPKKEITPAEMIRVRAGLIDNLNTLSLEESMSRIGMEQHLKMVEVLLNEMKACNTRQVEQLYVLEKELSNIFTKEGRRDLKGNLPSKHEALEREQYALLGQIIVGLREKVIDSNILLKSINDLRVSMENLIVTQSRSNIELQNKLTDTRMVAFETIVPRLAKIVRQISGELNKKIEFKVKEVEGEMDRTTLEHLIPSLEHILRNAVDHGIETVEERKRLNKPREGTLEIDFSRQGSTVVIEIKDDGRGLDYEAIRKKAIHLGRLDPNKAVTETELLHFIFEPGFSTQEKLTQISGRGVGLDVVNAAVKELGGVLSVNSKKDQFTQFILRFPFTSSLNRVLIFKVEDQIFGIMLSHIEGIEKIATQALKSLMQKKKPVFVFNHQPYYLHYLAFLLETDVKKVIMEKRKDFPIILVPSKEYPMALVVDEILYSRELVIQSLGAQFKFLDECNGAALLGDGSVVLILDPISLINTGRVSMTQEKSVEFTEKIKTPHGRDIIILVVDDSMTLRTVTKRFLERHKYRVMTAQDGLDALQQIQKQMPDLILLDIDMPRMDGFEFTLAIRQDNRFKHIPIIVITSRTSERHSKQAKALNVNGFIEKPFQENRLLESIEELLGERE